MHNTTDLTDTEIRIAIEDTILAALTAATENAPHNHWTSHDLDPKCAECKAAMI